MVITKDADVECSLVAENHTRRDEFTNKGRGSCHSQSKNHPLSLLQKLVHHVETHVLGHVLVALLPVIAAVYTITSHIVS